MEAPRTTHLAISFRLSIKSVVRQVRLPGMKTKQKPIKRVRTPSNTLEHFILSWILQPTAIMKLAVLAPIVLAACTFVGAAPTNDTQLASVTIPVSTYIPSLNVG